MQASILTTFALFSLLFFPETSASVVVGPWELPTRNGITGTLSFLSPNKLTIEGFSFDGAGIDIFLFFYEFGQVVDGRSGTIVPITGGGARGQLERRRYINEVLVAELPEGVTACDLGTLTVWCERFVITLARVSIPNSVFVNDGIGDCQLVGSPMYIPTDIFTIVPTIITPTTSAVMPMPTGTFTDEPTATTPLPTDIMPTPEPSPITTEPPTTTGPPAITKPPQICPPKCSYKFCSKYKNKYALCSNPHPSAHSNCTKCDVTYCHACYNSLSPVKSPPRHCGRCYWYDLFYNYRESVCFKKWAECVRIAHLKHYKRISYRLRSESNFACYNPVCDMYRGFYRKNNYYFYNYYHHQ